MNELTGLLVFLGTSVGFVVGVVWADRGSLRTRAERDELRESLRYVRVSIALDAGYRGLVRYIDRLLGDEAA